VGSPIAQGLTPHTTGEVGLLDEGSIFVPDQRLGYRRVSSFEQNPERQLEGLTLTRAFTDYASRKNPQRP